MDPMRFINLRLIGEPMNWAIVWLAASFWLLIFHVIMQAFTAMQTGPSAPLAPGIAQSLPTSPMPVLAVTPPSSHSMGTTGIWTDGVEANYAEDGWTA